MRSALVVVVGLFIASHIETTIAVAMSSALIGVVALSYAFYRTEVLRSAIDRQHQELNNVKRRVTALEPPQSE